MENSPSPCTPAIAAAYTTARVHERTEIMSTRNLTQQMLMNIFIRLSFIPSGFHRNRSGLSEFPPEPRLLLIVFDEPFLGHYVHKSVRRGLYSIGCFVFWLFFVVVRLPLLYFFRSFSLLTVFRYIILSILVAICLRFFVQCCPRLFFL